MVPGRIVDPDPDEPAEQKVVLQPLHQLPLRADRVERLQQHRPQQLLRRDRRPPDRRIQRRELPLQRRQRLVHDRPDRPQRMIRPHPRLKIDVAEQLARPIVAAAHHLTSESSRSQVNHAQQPGRERPSSTPSNGARALLRQASGETATKRPSAEVAHKLLAGTRGNRSWTIDADNPSHFAHRL